MQKKLQYCAALFLLSSCIASSQLPIKKISEPAGKAIDKALAASWVSQPGAKPFHLKLTIAPVNGDSSLYSSTIEETWISADEWRRVVTSPALTQTSVMNATGLHIVTQGDYYPMWLRSFVTALFNPVPDLESWHKLNAMIEHIELPNGVKSTPCVHSEFFFGEPPARQINFANVCIKDGLLEMVQGPDYAAEFSDYVKFGKLKVAKTITINPTHGVSLKGTVEALEPASADSSFFTTPDGSSDKDPMESHKVTPATLTQLAGGTVHLPWPNPIPGAGMFTVWVSLDKMGTIREAHSLNSDESNFAAEMAATLIHQHWKSPVLNGVAIQIQGPLVFVYPPPKE